MAKLNLRHILLHFIASWFFIYSFQTLATLNNTNLIDILRHSDEHEWRNVLEKNNVSTTELTSFIVWTSLANSLGLLVAFIISLSISIKRKWFWVNSLIVLLLLILLGWLGFLGWKYLKVIFLAPGQIFSNSALEFFTNGVLLLLIGLLIFFSGKTNKFINSAINQNA